MKAHEVVYPACGSANSAVELAIAELEDMIGNAIWVDVSK